MLNKNLLKEKENLMCHLLEVMGTLRREQEELTECLFVVCMFELCECYPCKKIKC